MYSVVGGQAVGRVGGEHDALVGRAREQLDHVEREEAGDVVEHARVIGQARGDDALVADRAVGEDQDHVGVAQGEIDELVAQRGKAAPGMDQDRHRGVFGQREDAIHLGTGEAEGLSAGMQLDPARAGRKAALALRDRIFGRVEAAEGRASPLAFPAQASTRSFGRR